MSELQITIYTVFSKISWELILHIDLYVAIPDKQYGK